MIWPTSWGLGRMQRTCEPRCPSSGVDVSLCDEEFSVGVCFSHLGVWRHQRTGPGANVPLSRLCISPSKCLVFNPWRFRGWGFGAIEKVALHSLICMLDAYWKLLWWSVWPEVSAESSQHIHKNINVVWGPGARQPGEMSPVFSCDSLAVMRGPICEESKSSAGRCRSQERAVSAGHSEIASGRPEVRTHESPHLSSALLHRVLPKLHVFPVNVPLGDP